jgi:hypothetical protein
MQTALRRVRGALVALLLLSGSPRLIIAQAGPPWLGDRVRVSHTDPCCKSPQAGRFVSLGADSVVLLIGRGQNASRLALPRRAVRTLEHGQQAGTYIVRGTVLGLLGGTAAAAGALAIQAANACADCWGTLLLIPYVVPAGALVGALVGAAIGDGVSRIRWRRVPLPASVGVAPAGNGRPDGALHAPLTETNHSGAPRVRRT